MLFYSIFILYLISSVIIHCRLTGLLNGAGYLPTLAMCFFVVPIFVYYVWSFGFIIGEDFEEYCRIYFETSFDDANDGAIGFMYLIKLFRLFIDDERIGVSMIVVLGQIFMSIAVSKIYKIKVIDYGIILYFIVFNRLVFQVSNNCIRSNIAFVLGFLIVSIWWRSRRRSSGSINWLVLTCLVLFSGFVHPMSGLVFVGLLIVEKLVSFLKSSHICIITVILISVSYLGLGHEFALLNYLVDLNFILVDKKLVGSVRIDAVNVIGFSLWLQYLIFGGIPLLVYERFYLIESENVTNNLTRASVIILYLSLLVSTELSIRIAYFVFSLVAGRIVASIGCKSINHLIYVMHSVSAIGVFKMFGKFFPQ